MKDSSLTSRSIAVGLTGLFIVTVLSMYVALRMGALPWPTVFVTVFASVCLKRAKGVTIQEINCTHTLMSAGSMVAGGLAFTLPGLWILNPQASFGFVSLAAVAVSGAVLGTLFTGINRRMFIEVRKLPYPIGQSAFETLKAAMEGKGAGTVFSSIGFSAVLAFVRDYLLLIPSYLTVFSGNTFFPGLSLYVSPMALGIGVMIGGVFTLVWFLGMVLGYGLVMPLGTAFNLFPDMVYADEFRSNLGIGLMVGVGLGVAVRALIMLFRTKKEKTARNGRVVMLSAALCAVCVCMLTVLTDLTFVQSVLLIPGVYLAAYLSGMLTGQTGINPMEIFAILVLLFIGAVTKTTLGSAFAVAGTVAVASGVSGDVLNDFKSGSLAGTSPSRQLKAEAVGAVAGAFVSVCVLFLIKQVYPLGGQEFPAPQAKAVASMINGLSNPLSFYIGLGLGFVLFLLKVPVATLGLGVYLPTGITSSVALGGLIMFVFKRFMKGKPVGERLNLVASGFLGGEGLAGVVTALVLLLS